MDATVIGNGGRYGRIGVGLLLLAISACSEVPEVQVEAEPSQGSPAVVSAAQSRALAEAGSRWECSVERPPPPLFEELRW